MNCTITTTLTSLCLSAALAASAFAGTIHVPAEHLTIQAAIVAAEPGDAIIVAPGTYNEAINFNGKAITIRSSAGPSRTTIDATGLNLPVVRIVSGEGQGTTLEGFTLTGGVGGGFPSGGGGLRITNASPTIIDCVITGNDATSHGGGAFCSNSNPQFINSNFTANTVGSDGGAIYATGSTLTIDGCAFTGHQARSGGAIALFNESLASITNSDFTGNSTAGSSSSGGGAVFINSHSVAAFINCTFHDNVKGGSICCGGFSQGGAVAAANHLSGGPGHATFDSCTFSNNVSNSWGGAIAGGTESSLVITDCDFVGNTANSGGGAVHASANLTLAGSSFVDNFNQGNVGGTLRIGPSATVQPIVGCSFIGNSSGTGPGAMSSSVFITLVDCHFEDNLGGGAGGGAGLQAGGAVEDCTFVNNAAGTAGGGLSIVGASTITRSTFVGNQAATGGGGGGGGGLRATGAATLTNCVFIDNTSHGSGGGNGLLGGGGGALLASGSAVNCLFAGNTANVNGGGLRIDANGSAVNCTVIGNTSSGGIISTGGIRLGGTASVTNSIVRGNLPNQITGTSNLTVSFSNVQGGFTGTGNINADPLFVDADGGDYRLTAKSPSVDSGNTSAVPADVFTDLDGNARVVNCIVDMGAYETQDIAGNPADLTGSGTVGVADLLVLLAAWGSCPDTGACPADLNCDGSVGVADLLILLANWG